MAHREPAALWREAVGQTLTGRRGRVKAAAVWLPLAAVASVSPSEMSARGTVQCFQILAAVACWVLVCILGNDLADRSEDRAARKRRWIQALPLGAGAAIVAGLAGIGALAVFLSAGVGGPLAAYAAATALGLLYSVRGVRLKERGLLGPLAYSGAAAVAYVLVPWTWLGAGWTALAVLGPAVLLDKWVNLHFHQVIDHEADRQRANSTYAVRVGVARARRTLGWAAGLASASMLGVLAFLAFELADWGLAIAAAGLGVAVAAALAARSRRGAGKASALVRELPCHYLGLTYAAFRIVPLLLLVRLAVEEPTMWATAAAAALWCLVESWQAVAYRYE